jgi:hypothetical protein
MLSQSEGTTEMIKEQRERIEKQRSTTKRLSDQALDKVLEQSKKYNSVGAKILRYLLQEESDKRQNKEIKND